MGCIAVNLHAGDYTKSTPQRQAETPENAHSLHCCRTCSGPQLHIKRKRSLICSLGCGRMGSRTISTGNHIDTNMPFHHKKLASVVALAMGGLAACLSAVHAADIYPTPKECRLSGEPVPVSELVVHMRSEGGSDAMWQKLPAGVEGAYAVSIQGGKLTIYANDETGLFYARQSISQLQESGEPTAHSDPTAGKTLEEMVRLKPLPDAEIVDWPDLPFRGVVEGYYGAPWSHEARLSQFRFYGRNKMNTYIYGPKDDSYHHGGGCYQPYPAESADRIAALVRAAKENHVKFVWAIHPANTVRWEQEEGREQLEGLLRKLELMYDLGVRNFGLFVDDASGEINKVERQVQLANFILANFVRKHPDVQQNLLFCPTGYNKSWTNAETLSYIGEHLKQDIDMMWTGNTVVHDIKLGSTESDGQMWVNNLIKRPTFVWWNWPCNDFKRSRLCLGRAYGLDTSPEMRDHLRGLVANPMEYAETSKIGLFGVADYTWNITSYQPDKSWRAGIRRLFPRSAKSMQVFCDHNSNPAPNNHAFARDESREVADDVKQYLSDLADRKPNHDRTVMLERLFRSVASSGKELSESDDVAPMRAEVEPWIRKFGMLGQAGSMLMKVILEEKTSDNPAELFAHFLTAANAIAAMGEVARDEWSKNGITPIKHVEVGAAFLTPVVKAAFDYLNARMYAYVSQRKQKLPADFICSPDLDRTGVEAALDPEHKSAWDIKRPLKKGEWFGLDFGNPVWVNNISVKLECGNPGALLTQTEVSDDGQNWRAVGTPCTGVNILRTAPVGMRAAQVRLRVLSDAPEPCRVVALDVNVPVSPFISSDVPAFSSVGVDVVDSFLRATRVMEYTTMEPGQFLEMQLDAPSVLQSVNINLGNASIAEWAKVFLVTADGHTEEIRLETKGETLFGDSQWNKKVPSIPVTTVRLVNASESSQQVKLSSFMVASPIDGRSKSNLCLMDGDLSTALSCEKGLSLDVPVPASCTQVAIVGTAGCVLQGMERLPHHDDGVQVFKLPSGCREFRLSAPAQPGSFINEIIFR